MSSISSSRTRRRRLLLGLAAWPLAGLAGLAQHAGAAQEAPTAGLTRWGSGEFRRFGFLIYRATLWAGGKDPLRPPLALRLTYERNLLGRDIAAASVKEIRKLGISDDARLKRWGEQMANIFPDVRPGDHILGLHLSEGARFFYNDRPAGGVDDPDFARAFFAIWLDPKTSAPELRAALLQRPSA